MSDITKKVLIVEDDEHISKVYQIQLAKEGIIISIAQDGEEAVKLINNEKPDLVILDLMLPKKDGFWVLEEVKKNSKNSKMPVLVVSNLGQKADEKRAMDLGATEYLVKIDYPIQDIIDKIKYYLKK